MIHKACRLYSSDTARWNHGSGARVSNGFSAEVAEFPWMVQKKKITFK